MAARGAASQSAPVMASSPRRRQCKCKRCARGKHHHEDGSCCETRYEWNDGAPHLWHLSAEAEGFLPVGWSVDCTCGTACPGCGGPVARGWCTAAAVTLVNEGQGRVERKLECDTCGCGAPKERRWFVISYSDYVTDAVRCPPCVRARGDDDGPSRAPKLSRTEDQRANYETPRPRWCTCSAASAHQAKMRKIETCRSSEAAESAVTAAVVDGTG
jgi:hypothetical protein